MKDENSAHGYTEGSDIPNSHTERKPGYYWVRCGKEWEIEQWTIEGWICPDYFNPLTDEYWDEIDERPITRDSFQETSSTLNKPSGNSKEGSLLGLNESWPLKDIISKLIEASEILLNYHSYDGQGYEEIQLCVAKAKEKIALLDSKEGSEPKADNGVFIIINGEWFERSPDKVKDGDTLHCIVKTQISAMEEQKTKFGDAGIVDLHYDRVKFPNGEEYVYWPNKFIKLIPVKP